MTARSITPCRSGSYPGAPRDRRRMGSGTASPADQPACDSRARLRHCPVLRTISRRDRRDHLWSPGPPPDPPHGGAGLGPGQSRADPRLLGLGGDSARGRAATRIPQRSPGQALMPPRTGQSCVRRDRYPAAAIIGVQRPAEAAFGRTADEYSSPAGLTRLRDAIWAA
jgi:hypothetical protein